MGTLDSTQSKTLGLRSFGPETSYTWDHKEDRQNDFIDPTRVNEVFPNTSPVEQHLGNESSLNNKKCSRKQKRIEMKRKHITWTPPVSRSPNATSLEIENSARAKRKTFCKMCNKEFFSEYCLKSHMLYTHPNYKVSPK